MAKLDGMLNEYVKPGTEAQVLQGAAFLVKNKNGMLALTSAFIICPCLSHSLFVYHRWQYTVLNISGKLNFESESPQFDADSVCWTASMTKLLTTVSVMQLMEKHKGPHGAKVRLYPVGRLDYLSEGLLLMTNDGNLANALSKAAAGVEKTYLVKVSGVPTPAGLDQIRHGIMIDRGRLDEVRGGRRDRVITSPAKVEVVRGGDNPWFELTLTEGRNRQIRKMFEEIGHHVEKIRRIGYGALRLDVPPGEFRELKPGEVTALNRADKGQKVVPKKKTPEFAQLKSPVKKKPTFGRRRLASKPSSGR